MKDVALVLSSGGPRGFAYIGAIEELESRGYRITSVAGTSIGSLIGGMYAAGKLQEVKEWLFTLNAWKVFGLIANISRQALETAKNFKAPATEKQQLYDSFKSNDAYFNRLLKSFIASDCETEVPHNAAPENNRPKAGSLPELLTKCNMDKKTFIRKVGLSELSFLKITMGDKCVSARIIDKMAKCLNTDKAAILAVVKEKEEQPRGL